MTEDPLKVERITAIAEILFSEVSAEGVKASFGLLDTTGAEDDHKIALHVIVSQGRTCGRGEYEPMRMLLQPSEQQFQTFETERDNPFFLALALQRDKKIVEVHSIACKRKGFVDPGPGVNQERQQGHNPPASERLGLVADDPGDFFGRVGFQDPLWLFDHRDFQVLRGVSILEQPREERID